MSLVNKNILVIDDTASIRTFLRIFVQGHGANFLEAENAAKGMEVRNEFKPDLVVLDLGLPDRDGLDILPEIKKPDDDGYAPKIIILSVRKDQTTKDRAHFLGADAYLSKPFLMEDLLNIIDKQIGDAN